MAGSVYGIVQDLAWVRSFKASNDDEHSDRLNHRYTVGFLLVCATIVTGSPFVFNRITCWVPAQFTGAYLAYTNNYCWITNTYYVPSNVSLSHNDLDRKRAEIGYYQWTPFILLLFAFGFYLPRMLWRSMNIRSGVDLQDLINRSETEEIVHAVDYYCQSNRQRQIDRRNRFFRTLSCTGGKRLGNYLRSLQIIVKLLYLVNSFSQLILIHLILGQPGWFYGFDIWYNLLIRNSTVIDSPYFPRVTLCDLQIREIGTLHHYTVQCVLPINMLNEKVFSLTYFWLLYMFLANLFSFVSTVHETSAANQRVYFVRKLLRISPLKVVVNEALLKQFIGDYLKQDGVLIIHLIDRNGSAFVASKVVACLYTNFEKNHLREI